MFIRRDGGRLCYLYIELHIYFFLTCVGIKGLLVNTVAHRLCEYEYGVLQSPPKLSQKP